MPKLRKMNDTWMLTGTNSGMSFVIYAPTRCSACLKYIDMVYWAKKHRK